MGGIGAVAEPLVVVFLLFGGTWINRDFDPGRKRPQSYRSTSQDDLEFRSSSPSLLMDQEPHWRTQTLHLFKWKSEVITPNTRRFRGSILSRLLEKFPFLVECWYWALIYWVYQLGRAATAVWIVEGTVHVARKHALQVIAWEQNLNIFHELEVQQRFMGHPFLMTWINRIYSFIHIPGSIAFLIWLFYYTNTRNRLQQGNINDANDSPADPRLYESRRRTMALCNLLAFIVFTLWPCMPPRLLSADESSGESGSLARSFGFVDTVHGPLGEGSVWTDNRFTNKFAAMPSLHFGYSLLIGLTVATIPLNPAHEVASSSIYIPFVLRSIPLPSWRRASCLLVGFLYPATILTAIIATANHFFLDAVAGSCICGIAWWGNDFMLNLLVIEDWFLWIVRIHKPESYVVEFPKSNEDEKGAYIR